MPDPITLEQKLTNEISVITDAQVRVMVAAWVAAFSEISADLEQSLKLVLKAGTRVSVSTMRRNRRLAQSLAAVADKLDELVSDAGVTITTDLADVVARGTKGPGQLIGAQLDTGEVLPDFDPKTLPDTRQLEAIVKRSTTQITSQLRPLAPETEDLVRRELVRGVVVGSNPKVTARRMVDRVDDKMALGLTRATVIARTETLDAYREGAKAGEKVHSKVLAGWVWLCHLGPRTCPSCLAQHGSLHDLDEAGPKDHPQGRCARMSVPRRADGSVNLSFVPDARAFFDALPEADQVAVMGRRRLDLLNSGAIDFADLSKVRHSKEWRSSWVVTPLRDLQAIAARKAA